MKRWVTCLIVLLVIVAGALVGCSEKTPAENKSSTSAANEQQTQKSEQPNIEQKAEAGTSDKGLPHHTA